MINLTRLCVVLGGGGFIGHHLVSRLTFEGNEVFAVDLKAPDFEPSKAASFILGDLRNQEFVSDLLRRIFDSRKEREVWIFQLAADMGGAGFVFTGDNDADIMHNSAQINLNVLDSLRALIDSGAVPQETLRIFYSSSACIYPQEIQTNSNAVDLPESAAYPANPDSDYGWEKLFSERLYEAYARNYGIDVRIARYHNIYGPLGTWTGGREKSPAALCRKIAHLPPEGGFIEIWGDGSQTRSYLFIEDCIEATLRLMSTNYTRPVNIGSEEMVTVTELAQKITAIAQKTVNFNYATDKPVGVRGRNSNNDLVRKVLGWDYTYSLEQGLAETYPWIDEQVRNQGLGSKEKI